MSDYLRMYYTLHVATWHSHGTVLPPPEQAAVPNRGATEVSRPCQVQLYPRLGLLVTTAMAKKGKREKTWTWQGEDQHPLICPGLPSEVIAPRQWAKGRMCLEGGNFSGQYKFRLPTSQSANALTCKHMDQDRGSWDLFPVSQTPWCSSSPATHFHQPPLYLLARTLEHRDRSRLASFFSCGFSSWAGGALLLPATWRMISSISMPLPHFSLPITGVAEFKMKTWLGRCVFSPLEVFVHLSVMQLCFPGHSVIQGPVRNTFCTAK